VSKFSSTVRTRGEGRTTRCRGRKTQAYPNLWVYLF